jgi:hypothetical protein
MGRTKNIISKFIHLCVTFISDHHVHFILFFLYEYCEFFYNELLGLIYNLLEGHLYRNC